MNRKIADRLTLSGSVKVYSFNAWGDLYSPGSAGEREGLRALVEVANERNGGTGATLSGVGSALRACGLYKGPRGWVTPSGWGPCVVEEIGQGI